MILPNLTISKQIVQASLSLAILTEQQLQEGICRLAKVLVGDFTSACKCDFF